MCLREPTYSLSTASMCRPIACPLPLSCRRTGWCPRWRWKAWAAWMQRASTQHWDCHLPSGMTQQVRGRGGGGGVR